MTDYNPFERGPHPVGTRQFSWADQSRDHTMPVDVWYPATNAHAGEDFDPDKMAHYEMVPGFAENSQHAVMNAIAESGRFPLVVFSHGYGGERRQSTFFYTHLASHGYVVAAMDHVGNTTIDMVGGQSTGDVKFMNRFIQSRPVDASFVIDKMLEGAAELEIDADRVGMSGHSFGGWTTLKTVETDTRIKAILPLAPAGGRAGDDENPLPSALSFDWQRTVPAFYIVSDLDSILQLLGMRDLHQRNPEPKITVVLENADHFHFNDNVEATHDGFKLVIEAGNADADDEAKKAVGEMLSQMKPSTKLVPGSHAHTLINGLGMAHFDAHLRNHEGAAVMLQRDLTSLMAERGVTVSLMS
jgi:dienelactone hydrolase